MPPASRPILRTASPGAWWWSEARVKVHLGPAQLRRTLDATRPSVIERTDLAHLIKLVAVWADWQQRLHKCASPPTTLIRSQFCEYGIHQLPVGCNYVQGHRGTRLPNEETEQSIYYVLTAGRPAEPFQAVLH